MNQCKKICYAIKNNKLDRNDDKSRLELEHLTRLSTISYLFVRVL